MAQANDAQKPCPTCGGSGRLSDPYTAGPCLACDGSGYITTEPIDGSQFAKSPGSPVDTSNFPKPPTEPDLYPPVTKQELNDLKTLPLTTEPERYISSADVTQKPDNVTSTEPDPRRQIPTPCLKCKALGGLAPMPCPHTGPTLRESPQTDAVTEGLIPGTHKEGPVSEMEPEQLADFFERDGMPKTAKLLRELGELKSEPAVAGETKQLRVEPCGHVPDECDCPWSTEPEQAGEAQRWEYEDEDGHKVTINAAKRLGIEYCDQMNVPWFQSYSPRNRNQNAEGTWADWVELAHRILDHPLSGPQEQISKGDGNGRR